VRRVPRWFRTGAAAPFGAGSENAGPGVEVGWTWVIKRENSEPRSVHVEVLQGNYNVAVMPAEARNAIRSRGATAVDAYLDQDDPPARIVVSASGVQPYVEG